MKPTGNLLAEDALRPCIRNATGTGPDGWWPGLTEKAARLMNGDGTVVSDLRRHSWHSHVVKGITPPGEGQLAEGSGAKTGEDRRRQGEFETLPEMEQRAPATPSGYV
ncbi:LOW QUALITY PROTEIN: hypothetical protein ColTof4_03036 [Colletotrichum tofieldiae]|nr:LOW QUALITY PROTEIN: hypothetical protein ColTof3_13558 [Colletotrichum tofieldiae]GKT70613.1 LOW QUALITY PROTEIN: hypothetical protein ColTof4_03036 [Colletotrichum tofieldiae]